MILAAAAIPSRMGDWTYDVVLSLLAAHAYEDARVEWKQDLRPNHGERLINVATAIANGEGGFLVFGISDNRDLPPDQRILGISKERDFGHEISQLIANADPSVPHRIQNPPIAIPGSPDRVVPVVQILTGIGPHSYNGIFYRRDGSKTRFMTTGEAREMFSRREETLGRLRLLLLELASAREAALCVQEALNSRRRGYLRRLDTRLLGELHAGVLPLLQDDQDLSVAISTVRSIGEMLNYQLDGMRPVIFNPAKQGHREKEEALDVLIDLQGVSKLADLVTRVVIELAKKFALPAPKLVEPHELRQKLL